MPKDKDLSPVLMDSLTRRENIRRKTLEGLSESFPLQTKNYSVSVNNPRVDVKEYSSRQQKNALLAGTTLSERVRGDLVVKDSSGKIVNEAKDFTLMRLPYFTPRHTFIVDGTEYSVSNQIRTKPGVYTRRRGNDELEATFNLSKGSNFRVLMDPAKGYLYAQPTSSASRIPLYPVLRALGIPHQDIAKNWGSTVAETNRSAFKDPGRHVDKFYKSFIHPSQQVHKTPEDRVKAVHDYLDKTRMSPEVTKRTLGTSYEKASPLAILAASKKLLDVHRQEAETDDRDSLEFKTFHSVDDFFKERLHLDARGIRAKLGLKLDAYKGNIRKALPPAPFTRSVHSFLSKSALSAVPMQINPMELMDSAVRITSLGEGAISSDRAIPLEARNLHPTHFAVMDPVRTPESFKAGIDIRAAMTTRRDEDGNLYAMLRDVKTGRRVPLKATDIAKAVVAFPGENVSKGRVVDVMRNGKVERAGAGKVTHQVDHASDLYGPTTNLLPLLNGMQGNRALMGSKQQSQALSLINREAPLVQVSSWNPLRSIEQEMVTKIVPTAPVAGTIEKIDEDYIYLRPTTTKQGSVEDASLYKRGSHEEDEEFYTDFLKFAGDDGLLRLHYDQNFPLAAKSYLHNNLKVKVGDKVRAGQPLADSNYTKDDTLALGTNLSVAYMPYRGLNTNDGIVVSEGAAKRLTSEHMYKYVMVLDGDLTAKREKHRAYFGSTYSAKQYDQLDENGVIKKGATVQPDDPLIVAVRETKATGNAVLLGRLSKSLVKPYVEETKVWDHDRPGTIMDVVKTPRRITVTVKTEERLGIGDKLSNRFGAKGVIAKIVPDRLMIHDESKKPIDLLFTSAGVVSRINPGQIVEAALGKVADKTGKPIVLEQFADRDNVEHAKKLLKKHGLKDKETVFDPDTGKKIPNVFVGKSYILKLFKTTDSNWAAHGAERYDFNQQPARGGADGAKAIGKMEFDGLVAHNARNVLREAASIKGQRNDEFWRAVQLGLPTPAPQTSFAYNKFLTALQGAGVKVDKQGNRLALGPLTDRDISRMSSGALKAPQKLLRAKDLKPENGGLFDPVMTGGTNGTKWSHVDLHEPVVNPVFEEPVRRLLGLTKREFTEQHGKHGGAHFKRELKKIDVDRKLRDLHASTKTLRGANLDNAVKQIKYLTALKRQDLKPHDAYVLSKIPVTPPVIRPVLPLKDGRLQVGDANLLYRDAFLANKQLGAVKGVLPPDELKQPRRHLFEAIGAVFGTHAPTSPTSKKRGVKGYLNLIAGTRPGSGFFQSKLMKRQQDVSGRATIAPDPTLSMDEVGIPEDMLWGMYGKFVIGRLVKKGYSALDAEKMVDEKQPLARNELLTEARERPVMVNRAPSLHRFNIVGAFPKIVSGKTIRLNPFAEKGLNADYDGDCQLGHVIIERINADYCDVPKFGVNWWQLRKVPAAMTARFKEIVGYENNSEFFVCALQDFPHGTLESEHEHRQFYEVPEGIRVIAHDPDTGQLTLTPVSKWSIHKDRVVETVTLASGRQIITDDDPRAVYGVTRDLELVRKCPKGAQDVFVPVAKELSVVDASLQKLDTGPGGKSDRKKRMYKTLPLDETFGYLCGLLTGDGWYDSVRGSPKAVHLANTDPQIHRRYQELLASLFRDGTTAEPKSRKGEGYGPNSQKLSVTSVEYANVVKELIGRHARNKHLPVFFMFAPAEFRIGLLAGLFDSDGSIAISNAKAKPQWIINHSTTSIRLAQEIVLLYKTFGIKAGINAGKTPKKLPNWVITPSSVELHKLKRLPVAHEEKAKRFTAFFAETPNTNAPSYVRTDLVPIPKRTAETFAACYRQGSMYGILRKAYRTGYITRASARRAVQENPTVTVDKRWQALVDDDTITWDRVVAYETTDIRETGYDLTVPGSETFMAVDGVILSNTVQIHAPVTPGGVADVKKMTLSNLIFSDRKPNYLNVAPEMESVLGLHRATAPGSRGKSKHFATKADAVAAYHRGELSLRDNVEIGQ